MRPRILIADDDADIRGMLNMSLQIEGYAVETFESGEKLLCRMEQDSAASLVILDLLMPGLGGIQTLQHLRKQRKHLPVLVLSCQTEPDVIVNALQQGATDYMTKPFEAAKLHHRIRRLSEAATVAPAPKSPIEGMGFIALHPRMLEIAETIQQIANTDVPVFIHGESGVGKEMVARAIHECSERRNMPFLKINCSSVPAELLESEMFGYERGAFTGAVGSKPGKFELAHKGTMFLDEIAEMAPAMQAKLLQVLQDNQFIRLGGTTVVRVDTRVLAATNVNIEQALKSGAFRHDLFYRLNVVNLRVPPLRERMEELPALASYFFDKYKVEYNRPDSALTPRFVAALKRHHWPGNVRELENVIRRYLVLDGSESVVEALEGGAHNPLPSDGAVPELESASQPVPFATHINELKNLAQREAILKVLNQTNWHRKTAAQVLNLSYKSLLYRMKVLKIGSR